MDELVDPVLNLNLGDAWQINASGQITAAGFTEPGHVFVHVVLTPSFSQGDVNQDCITNIDDLVIVIKEWGKTKSIADINHDEAVNVSDLLIVVHDWG